MQLQSLKHLLSVVQAIAQPERVFIFGSACLLCDYPHLGDSGQPLAFTQDADLLVRPIDDTLAHALLEAVGKEASFMQQFGYCGDILRPAIVETLPAGWETRLHRVAGYANVFALDAYDLALVKLVVGRQKDLDLLHALLKLGIVEPEKLRSHYQQTPLGEREAITAGRNLTLILSERRVS